MKKITAILLSMIFIFSFSAHALATESEDTYYIIMYARPSHMSIKYKELFSDHRELLNPENYKIDGISEISIIAAYRDDNPDHEPPYYVLAIKLSDSSKASASFYAAELLIKGISYKAFAADKQECDEFTDSFVPFVSIPEAHFALYTPGDIMCYNEVTSASARTVLRLSVGLDKKENYPYLLGDMNKDGELTASDARTILRISVGLE